MQIYEELQARGLIAQTTNEEEIRDLVNNGRAVFYIGFDPQFLTDAFNIVDSDKPLCFGTGSKAPLLINGDEYKILVLPVNIGNEDYSAEFTKRIRGEVA